MNGVSGHGRAEVQDDDGNSASSVAASSDPFGLDTYTGQTTQATGGTTRTSEPVEPPQPDQSEPARPDEVETRWRTKLGEPVAGGPVAHDGRVFATGRSGQVYALDATDGTERWQSAAGRAAATRPAADDGGVFVGHADGTLRALDATDGNVRWTYEVDDGIEAPPVVRDGVVHVASDAGQCYRIDADTGDRRGAFGHGSRAVCSLAVDGETVLLGSAGGGLQARCLTDGRERWRCLPEQAVVAASAVAHERAYIVTVDDDRVRAVDLVTGTVQERFEVGSAVWGRPAVTDDAVIVAGQDGTVSAFDPDGTRRWSLRMAGSAWSGPTVADGQVYVADDEGWAYALDAADGTERWRFEADAAITTAPTVADGAVVATEAGTICALTEV